MSSIAAWLQRCPAHPYRHPPIRSSSVYLTSRVATASRCTGKVSGRPVWLRGGRAGGWLVAGAAGVAGGPGDTSGAGLAPSRGRDAGVPTTPYPPLYHHPSTPGTPPLAPRRRVHGQRVTRRGGHGGQGSGGRLLHVPAPLLNLSGSVSCRLRLAGPAYPLVKSCTRVPD